MELRELPILNGRYVSKEDMIKLVDVLAYNDLQGGDFLSSSRHGEPQERCVYLFPKRDINTEEHVNVIKSVLENYGVKSDIHISHYHGVHQVVRMIIETDNQVVEYKTFGEEIAKIMTQKHYEDLRIAEQKRLEAAKAARREKIAKIFPVVRLFQKGK